MIFGIGTDIVNVTRLEKSNEFLERFVKRSMTEDNAPSRLRIHKKRGKILMLLFRSFIYFYHIPEVYRVDNYKIGKLKWCVC